MARTFGTALVCGAIGLTLTGGCGSENSLATVGYVDGGLGDFQTSQSDAQTGSALDAYIEQNRVSVKFVTVSCAGDCAEVQAVPTGGTPPYSFAWDDGSTDATRRVCPVTGASYSVKVTDTGSTGEFMQLAQTVDVTLGSHAPPCPDAGALDAGPQVDAAALASVTVPGTADIWLAGQPSGSMLAYENQSDVVPADSPVEVDVTAGTTLTFSASGSTSFTGGVCSAPSPDGGCLITVTTGPANGISSVTVLQDSLLGVFVGQGVPGGQAPAGLDFSTNTAFTTLSPLLDQVFFIGDGLTGTGTGTTQQFVVPAGATRLFLASSDDAGSSGNNTGQFAVSVALLP